MVVYMARVKEVGWLEVGLVKRFARDAESEGEALTFLGGRIFVRPGLEIIVVGRCLCLQCLQCLVSLFLARCAMSNDAVVSGLWPASGSSRGVGSCSNQQSET